ncbi:MAG: hypothetical protein K2W99_02550 [Chthoniobacterales bacterium]|nr:hypothetical protein [Chthoniobacterales bacterium]
MFFAARRIGKMLGITPSKSNQDPPSNNRITHLPDGGKMEVVIGRAPLEGSLQFHSEFKNPASNIKDPTSPNTIKSALKGSNQTIEFDPSTSPSTTVPSSPGELSNKEEGNTIFRDVEGAPVPITAPRNFVGKVAITPKELQKTLEIMKTNKLAKEGAYPSVQELWASEKVAAVKEDLEKATLGLAWAQKNTDFNLSLLSPWGDLAQQRYHEAVNFSVSLSSGGSKSDLYDPANSPKERAPSWSKPLLINAANIKQVVDSCAQAAKAEEKAMALDQQLKKLRQSIDYSEDSEKVLSLEKAYREADDQKRASAYQAHSLYKAIFPNQ